MRFFGRESQLEDLKSLWGKRVSSLGRRQVAPRALGEILLEAVVAVVHGHDDEAAQAVGRHHAAGDFVDAPLATVPRRGGVEQHIPVVHVEHVAGVARLITLWKPDDHIPCWNKLRFKLREPLQ